MSENVIGNKSYLLALRIIKAYKFLSEQKREFILSKQLLSSGTAVGALCREAEHTQSKADFLNKMNIALKEASEREYWLLLLKDSNCISTDSFNSIENDCSELIKLLASIVKSTKLSLIK